MNIIRIVSIFTLLSLHTQIHAETIFNINTTNDEFGENLATCSLREAIEAINTRTKFGGCPAGERYGTNFIQLEEKEYILLRGELIVKQPLTISGFYNNDLLDNITRFKPRHQSPTTVINARNAHRIFNTAEDKATLSLEHVKLINGYDDNIGGGILAGGSIVLNNVLLENNYAKNNGGALFLLGANSKLVSNDSSWINNQIATGKGSVLAMSCFNDLKMVERDITIKRNTFAYNGNSNNNSIIEGCGILALDIQYSTIGENNAKSNGAIINLNDDISPSSSINMENTTIVRNNSAPILKYAEINRINIKSSIIAFNNTSESCIGNNNVSLYTGNFNIFENCSPLNQPSTFLQNHDNDVHLKNGETSFSEQLNPLGDYGGYTQTYLPKSTATKYILNKVSSESCAGSSDQRGNAIASITVNEKCDIGSVERRPVLAIVDASTTAYFNKSFTDRITELSVLSNDIPSETDSTDNIPDARGQFAKDNNGNYLIKLTSNPYGFCSIVHRTAEGLMPLLRFDNQGKILSETQRESCKYTFTDTNGNTSNEGVLYFRTENKVPVANNDSFNLPSGATSLSMNLVANDNDAADGKYGGLCTADTVKCNGGYYIRIVSSPTIGTIEGDSRQCPDYTDSNKYQCYRGDLIYRPKNNIAPFNDSFTYIVYDNDLGVSEAATVKIINEAAVNADDTGGSLAWWSLLSLAGLALYRRRNIKIA